MIAVVLGCKDSKVRFAETARLPDHGFASHETVPTEKRPEAADYHPAKIRSAGSSGRTGRDYRSDSKRKKRTSLKISIDKSVACPVKKGEKVGTIHIYDGKKKIASYPLVSDRDAEKAGFMTAYIRMIKNLV